LAENANFVRRGPPIGGTAHLGQTLASDTSGITEADGLDTVSFSYRYSVADWDVIEA